MKKTIVIFLFSTWMLSIASASSASCSLGVTDGLYFSSSYESNKDFFYNLDGDQFADKKINIPNCKKEYSNYLMIGTGVKHVPKNPGIATTALEDNITPYHCSYKNLQTPFEAMSGEESKQLFSKEVLTLRNCLEFKLTENGPQKIIFDEIQEHCEIKKIDDFNVIIKGGKCLFKNHELAKFTLTVAGSSNCNDRDFLKENKMNPSAVDSEIVYYYTGSNDGETGYLNLLGKTRLQINIQAGSELIPLTDDMGTSTPTLPESWVFPTLNIGEITFKKRKERTSINIPFLIENLCKKSCKDGVCTSPCDYALPLGAQVSLYSTNKRNKYEIVDEWYQGAKIPANWQGSLASFQSNHRINNESLEITEGSRFKLEISFGDPKYNFNMLTRGLRSILGSFSRSMPSMDNGMIHNIPMITMPGLGGRNSIPTYQDLPNIGNGQLLSENFSRDQFHDMRELIQYDLFVPYYNKVCNKELTKCVSANIEKAVSYTIEFEVKKREVQNNRNRPFPGNNTGDSTPIENYIIDNITMTRNSLIDRNFQLKMKTEDQVKTSCKIVHP